MIGVNFLSYAKYGATAGAVLGVGLGIREKIKEQTPKQSGGMVNFNVSPIIPPVCIAAGAITFGAAQIAYPYASSAARATGSTIYSLIKVPSSTTIIFASLAFSILLATK